MRVDFSQLKNGEVYAEALADGSGVIVRRKVAYNAGQTALNAAQLAPMAQELLKVGEAWLEGGYLYRAPQIIAELADWPPTGQRVKVYADIPNPDVVAAEKARIKAFAGVNDVAQWLKDNATFGELEAFTAILASSGVSVRGEGLTGEQKAQRLCTSIVENTTAQTLKVIAGSKGIAAGLVARMPARVRGQWESYAAARALPATGLVAALSARR